MNSYITFDLETTGLSPDSSEILEIGAWRIENGVSTGKFNCLVRPVSLIPKEIQRITGITNEMVEDKDRIDEVLPEFMTFCGNLPFLGFSLPFDYSFLKAKSKHTGCDFTLNGTRCGIDVLKLCHKHLKGLPSYKLNLVAEYLNIALIDSNIGYHRATYDAYVTKLIYDRFLIKASTLEGVMIPENLNTVVEDKKYGKPNTQKRF